MQKIKQQVFLSTDVYVKVIEIQKKHNLRNSSQAIDKLLREAFRYEERMQEKEKTIMNLQRVITELGEKAEKYREQIVHKEENKK